MLDTEIRAIDKRLRAYRDASSVSGADGNPITIMSPIPGANPSRAPDMSMGARTHADGPSRT